MAKKYILTAPPTHPDGMLLGETSADKVALFGATPVVQPSGATQAAVSAAAIAAAAGANPTKAEYDALVTRFNALTVYVDKTRTDLIALGLQKGSA